MKHRGGGKRSLKHDSRVLVATPAFAFIFVGKDQLHRMGLFVVGAMYMSGKYKVYTWYISVQVLYEWYIYTLQGTNISHLGKRKIIFKMPFFGDMFVPKRVYIHCENWGWQIQLGELDRMQIWILWIYKNPWENNEVKTSQQKKDLELNNNSCTPLMIY